MRPETQSGAGGVEKEGAREAVAARARSGRWIRPARPALSYGAAPGGAGTARDAVPFDIEEVSAALLTETRRRLSGLAALERELEDKIRGRWQEAEEVAQRRATLQEEELGAARKRADTELKDLRQRSEKDGRASGFREGFARGREEGYRLGCEEGRREGLKEGAEEGRKESARKLEQELAGAVAAFAHAALELKEKRDAFLREARRDVITLSLEIARMIVKREVARGGDVVQRNVEKAVDLIFRRGALVVQVHPEDRAVMERALAEDPRWAEGFDAVEIRPAPDVSAGGCRLVSGAGTVDTTVETQLALIEEALRLADDEEAAPRGEHP